VINQTTAGNAGELVDGWPLGDGALSAIPYVSQGYFEREKDAIFRNSWLLMCRTDEIRKPGEFAKIDYRFLETSLILVRGKDDKIRAFHNTCKHRGAAICMDPKGQVKNLVCPFHGWVYNLKGELLDITFNEHFSSLPDKSKLGLSEVHCDTWGGFVWVNLAPKPEQTLREYLSALPQPLQDYFSNEKWYWSHGFKYEIQANWKEIMGVQHEGYHVNFLHKRTVEAAMSASDAPVWMYPNKSGLISKAEIIRPVVGSGAETQQTLVGNIAFKHTDAAFLYSDFEVKGVHTRYPGAVNTHHNPRWSFDAHLVFPNTSFHVWNDQLLLHRVIPINEHRSIWLYDFFFLEKPPERFGQLFARTYGIMYGRDIVSEDTTTLEGMHRSLKSGVIKNFYLNELELAPRALHQRVLDVVGKP